MGCHQCWKAEKTHDPDKEGKFKGQYCANQPDCGMELMDSDEVCPKCGCTEKTTTKPTPKGAGFYCSVRKDRM